MAGHPHLVFLIEYIEYCIHFRDSSEDSYELLSHTDAYDSDLFTRNGAVIRGGNQ
jgi:hypothetical protein